MLIVEEEAHIETYLRNSLSLDVIANRHTEDCSIQFSIGATTLYRRAKKGLFDLDLFHMKEKRKPNGYTEKRGKQPLITRIYDEYMSIVTVLTTCLDAKE